MADWHVSDSDSGDEYESSLDSSTILTVRIDRDKVLELLKAVEVKKTLELECLSRVVRKEHHKRNGRLHTQPAASPASQAAVDQHSGEEVSESPSLKSAHTASTGGTECRDSRKPTLSAFDYQHEDDFPIVTGKNRKRKLPPKKDFLKKPRITCRLNNIVAEMRKEKEEQQQWSREENGMDTRDTEEMDVQAPVTTLVDDTMRCSWKEGNGYPRKLDPFTFEDGDSDSSSLNSDLDGMSLKINRVEQILDAEGFI